MILTFISKDKRKCFVDMKQVIAVLHSPFGIELALSCGVMLFLKSKAPADTFEHICGMKNAPNFEPIMVSDFMFEKFQDGRQNER